MYLRIFFFRPLRGGSLVNRLINKGVADVSRLLDYGELADIQHVAVDFAGLFSEVTIDGTTVDERLLNLDPERFYEHMPRLEAYFEYDLRDLSESAINAHKFVMKNQAGMKIDVPSCLKYAWELKASDIIGYEDYTDVLSEPKAHICNNTLQYSLPYTCTTTANLLLWKVAEVELSPEAFIAPNLFVTCLLLHTIGVGTMYTKDDIWIAQ